MADNTQRRVVITGLGVVAPNGIGIENFWQATLSGTSGITCLRHNSSEAPGALPWVAGTIHDFIAEDYIERKQINRTDRMTHFAFATIQEALTDARLTLERENPQRVGAVIANTMGGVEFVLKQLQTLYTRGPRFVSAYTAIAWLNVANVGQAAIRHGIQGYCKAPVNDAASGLDAIGMAYRAIRRAAADVIITGGSEAFLHPVVLQVMERQGICFAGDDAHAYRPFDRRACGLIMAEGAGMCILEEYEHARQRGAAIYGEVSGYGQANDIQGLLVPIADGFQYARAIRLALQEAGIQSADLAYINPDGRAVPTSDEGEANALEHVFGSHLASLPISVPRTMLGHSYAAAGVIDTITALLALKHGLIPPTINCEELNPRYGLDLVQDEPRPIQSTSRAQKPSAVLIGGRSIGGANVALVLKKAV